MALKEKDLIGLQYTTADEIAEILETAATMKSLLMQGAKKMPHLQGKSIISLFYENSTRTRMSFELAGKYLGASTSNISAAASSVQKGETLIDTGRTLDAMGTDIIIMRHPMSGAAKLLAENVGAGVINAGDGMHEHPTQALLDMFTMKDKLKTLEGINVAIIGDIYHSRVARSNVWGLNKMGANVTVCGPFTMLPVELDRTGAKVTPDMKSAVKDADVVMGLRIQKERQKGGAYPSVREYHHFYGINENVMKLAKKNALVMHPGPINRGIEIASVYADGGQSVINEQVTNGLAVRMALLFLLTRGKKKNETIN